MTRKIKNRGYERMKEMRECRCKDKKYDNEGENDERERESDGRRKISRQY